MEHAVQKNTTVSNTKKQESFFGGKTASSFFEPSLIQPKLSIGAVDDPYEREADATADKVMRMTDADVAAGKVSNKTVQRKCEHCEEEEKNLQRKPIDTTIQRDTAENDSGEKDKNIGRPYLHLSISVPYEGKDEDNKINFAEANIQLINQGIDTPADYTVDYSNLWKADYELSKGLRLGTMVKNLYGMGERFDAKALRPVRGVVKRIPLVGGLLKDAIKLEAPKVEGGDWDRYLTNKMAISGLRNSISHDHPEYNEVSGVTFTINVVDFKFDENKISEQYRKSVSTNDDVLRRKCSSCEVEEKLQKKDAGAASQATTESNIQNTLQSSGKPMDPATQSFMEERFGYDFSKVQIHNDSNAQRSSADINALAYTHGNHIVFGAGQYQPTTNAGKKLLAHELTHVVQQGEISNLPIQRRTSKAKSWAGDFVADNYEPEMGEGNGEDIIYGASIEISFTPNDFVDAEKIVFMQTAQSFSDGSVLNRYDERGDAEKKSFESRMISSDKMNPGVHIDQDPKRITPVYGNQNTSSKITDTTSFDVTLIDKKVKSMEEGWHYNEADGSPKSHVVKMADDPSLSDKLTENLGVSIALEQHFESTPMAIAGNQNGVFYGSVEWGWKKASGDFRPQLLDFKIKSNDVPSDVFREAARLWNRSKSSTGVDSIYFKVPELMRARDAVELKDEKRNVIGMLKKHTGVEVVSTMNTLGVGGFEYDKVTVIDGSEKGKSGYIIDDMLYTPDKSSKSKEK